MKPEKVGQGHCHDEPQMRVCLRSLALMARALGSHGMLGAEGGQVQTGVLEDPLGADGLQEGIGGEKC